MSVWGGLLADREVDFRTKRNWQLIKAHELKAPFHPVGWALIYRTRLGTGSNF